MDIGLTEDEIDWCKGNSRVDAAAHALAAYRAYLAGVGTQAALVSAVAALRRVRPRPPLVIDRLYVYLLPRPEGEGVPGVEGPSGRMLLMGIDKASMRGLAPAVDAVQKASGLKCSLWRFRSERVITEKEIGELESRNEASGRCVEAFAFVGKSPSGDEMPMALPGPRGPEPLIHSHAAEVRRMAERLSAVPGGKVELRRYVRREPVPSLAV